MPFDKKTLIIPNETIIEESTISTNGDTIVDFKSDVKFSFKTDKRIFVGDSVKIMGNLEAEDDIRIDTFSEIDGDIKSNNDIYLGEKVHIKGKLTVGRDLDVENDVKIDEGYEAKGWINVQSSFSWLTYIFAYLLYLFRRGESEQISTILKELESEDPMDILIHEIFLFIPKRTIMNKENIDIKGNCRIGEKCKIKGYYKVSGMMKVGDDSEVEGSIDADESIELGSRVTVHGKISTKSGLKIGEDCVIEGEVFSKKVEMYQTSTVTGTIHAEDGINILNPETDELDEKVDRFESGMDDIGDMLD